jgi:hypothetical protein
LNDRLVMVGLIVAAVLVLIPVVMIGRLIYGIFAGYRDYRRAEARKVTTTVHGLGEFSTTDNRLWIGEVRGLQVFLESPEQRPTDLQARQVLALLDDLPALTERAKSYLAEHEDTSWLNGSSGTFEPYGLEPESSTAFVLELTHSADSDGVYRVAFRDGMPVSAGRDD